MMHLYRLKRSIIDRNDEVLILVVMDDALVLGHHHVGQHVFRHVLILVVMDDALVP